MSKTFHLTLAITCMIFSALSGSIAVQVGQGAIAVTQLDHFIFSMFDSRQFMILTFSVLCIVSFLEAMLFFWAAVRAERRERGY